MNRILIFLLLFFTSISLVFAQVRVRGYYRKNGTYVQPHYRSKPDGNPYNNYSYPGNTNPYTGKTATGNPSTYLNNYNNKTYEGGYLNNRFYSQNNYTLLRTNYNFIGSLNSRDFEYKLQNQQNIIVGKIISTDKTLYEIFDDKSILIGYIKLRKNGTYKVYDTNFQRIRVDNSNNNNNNTILFGFLAAILFTVLIVANK
jgi:hypothetical protein